MLITHKYVAHIRTRIVEITYATNTFTDKTGASFRACCMIIQIDKSHLA